MRNCKKSEPHPGVFQLAEMEATWEVDSICYRDPVESIFFSGLHLNFHDIQVVMSRIPTGSSKDYGCF